MKEVQNMSPAEMEKMLEENPELARMVGPLNLRKAGKTQRPSRLISPPSREQHQPNPGKSQEELSLEAKIARARRGPAKPLPTGRSRYARNPDWRGYSVNKTAGGYSYTAGISFGEKQPGQPNTLAAYEVNLGTYYVEAQAAYARTVADKVLNHPRPVNNKITLEQLDDESRDQVVERVCAILRHKGLIPYPGDAPGASRNGQAPATTSPEQAGLSEEERLLDAEDSE
jgi:hypothetical protein